MGRVAYKTQCRFLRDHDTVSEIRWVEALPQAPTLPYVSAIMSRMMEQRPWPEDGVGEVFGAPWTKTLQTAPTGLNGSRLCGEPIDFEEGGAYQPDLPPAPYDSQGYLACCQVPPPPPPPPPPGCACAEATPIAPPIDQMVTMCVVGTQSYLRWFRFEVASSGLMNFKLTPAPFLPVFVGSLFRGSCGSLVGQWSFAGTVTVNAWPVTPGTYFVLLNGSGSSANSARVEISAVY